MTVVDVRPSGLAAFAAASDDPFGTLVKAWLSGQRSRRTIATYEISLRQWRTWCDERNVDPLTVVRAHVELYQRWLEADDREGKGVRRPRTIYARLTAMGSFYSYLVDEEVLDRDPMRRVKRPRIERRSPTGWLTRTQLADLITAAEKLPPSEFAAIMILVFNGLRVGELCSLDIDAYVFTGRTAYIDFTRKGAKTGRAVFSRPTEDAVVKAIAGRRTGPLLLNRYGHRMTQRNVQRILDTCLPEVRGVRRRITPHSLRHSWTTACVEAHVPADQIQYDGGWNDPRHIPYYSHGQENAAKAATHACTTYILGVA